MKTSSEIIIDDLLRQMHDLLYLRYGESHWWPAKTPFEVMVGAILTQNTAWGNVERAIKNFPVVTPEFIEQATLEELAEIIKPAGFFNQKAVYLKNITAWFKGYDYSFERAAGKGVARLRLELLALKGVGKETADSILLYAFELPTFVVDMYTRRLLSRIENTQKRREYDEVQLMFSTALEKEKWNNLHAMIVRHGKAHCRAKPECAGCPLIGMCGFGGETQRGKE
jgi:endonuclease-3 related protein